MGSRTEALFFVYEVALVDLVVVFIRDAFSRNRMDRCRTRILSFLRELRAANTIIAWSAVGTFFRARRPALARRVEVLAIARILDHKCRFLDRIVQVAVVDLPVLARETRFGNLSLLWMVGAVPR
jgi:hypothetical protein